MQYAVKVEYAHQKKIRARNKTIYRIAHWPIWIWVFFLAPGPLTFHLFAKGPGVRNAIWLAFVAFATGTAGLFGQLPGVEPKPYILRFCEDRPNPLYRRICYTFAWNALLNFAILNLVALIVAVITGRWLFQQIYAKAYLPVFLLIAALGAWGKLPRVGHSTKGEGIERRYFYGAVWAVTAAQITLLIAWKTVPHAHLAVWELSAFVGVLVTGVILAVFGLLPRTRPILPGETMVAD